MKRIGYILVFIILPNLLGCGTPPPYKAYQGEKKLTDLAIIQCDSNYVLNMWSFSGKKICIMKVDGKKTRKPFNLYVGFPEQAMVEPGRHSLEVKFSGGSWSADRNLWLDAEAGKTYIVRTQVVGYKVLFWIEEKESGKVVGGSVRSKEPKPEK